MKRLRFNGGARLNAATQATDAEKWSVLFPRGEWTGRNLAAIGGSITLDDEVFAEMLASWAAQERPALPVYWHHPPPIDEVPPADRKAVFRAAGHIEEMRVTPRGLEARIAWSQEGKAALDADEYRFISPEWQPSHPDRHTGDKRGWLVTGAALTDSPFFNEMPRVAASQSGTSPQEQDMNKQKLCAALGIPEDSTDDAVMEACVAACKARAAATESAEKITASAKAVADKDAALRAAHDAVTSATARATALQAEVERLTAARKAEQMETFIGGLTGFGAVQRESVRKYAAALGIEEAKAFAATMKPAGSPGEVGVTGAVEQAVDKAALKAAYEAELDKAQKAGTPVVVADAALRKDPRFAALRA